MIVDKVPLPEDPTPADAPPSYDSLTAGPSSVNPSLAAEEKSRVPSTSAIASGSNSPSTAQGDSLSSAKSRLHASSGQSKPWWSFSLAGMRTARQVRATISNLLHGIVVQLSEGSTANDESAIGILESCADTCIMHDISFSLLLQEKSIEGHTPIYWAILKRPTRAAARTPSPMPGPSRSRDLTLTLLKFSAPLTESTKSEIRLACMLNSDDALFQRIRSSDIFSPITGTDQILFGQGRGAKDRVRVVHMTNDDAAFAAHFEVPLFQKRMRVGGKVSLEFVAKGRLFRLSFLVASPYDTYAHGKTLKPGSWLVSLEILEHSPPTWIDSRLVIRESRYSSPPETPSTPPGGKAKAKPSITLRLKSSTQLYVGNVHSQGIQVGLDESLMGGNLMYE
ncbi:hypothetical protein GLOTRDRAFT_76794 [Gloeophyllum trabeum ATCC 11539]|uniref:Uncharacterized protein n=1 Tax=Gloeophyllum trabeum (strain ATCC 11539 / FP-39264 / Madison 617) TaxID=670483 RepID=S7RR46_GLOTA|nr:uncharacterized protein GLOTRDRAFT_76794 [Gloeophyllum trabeum ATCC 11539]EPQ55394.1 hypothetical protein GLOTRDRAFT_76794 [Gloeophyllum trabeum ATCC 11539]